MRPICATCGLTMPVRKNETWLIMLDDDDNPYKVWMGDLAECVGCGALVIAGFGSAAVRERDEDGFQELVDKLMKGHVDGTEWVVTAKYQSLPSKWYTEMLANDGSLPPDKRLHCAVEDALF